MNTILTRMENMLNDYDARAKAAHDRIVALGAELQQEKDLMAAADNMEAFAAHDARVRYLSSRIEAAKKEQIAPLFATKAEAIQLGKDYQAAWDAAAAPIYARLLNLIKEQRKLMQDLDALASDRFNIVNQIGEHASKQGCGIYPVRLPALLVNFPSEDVEACLQDCLA